MATRSRALALTMAILKPDISRVPYAIQEIHELILDHGFYFVRSKQMQLTRELAEEFYAEHKGRFFYNRLVTFMSSGPVLAHVLAHPYAVSHWRALMGPTRVFQAQFESPASIRGALGLTDTRNSSHGSDSLETAQREIQFFFPDFDWSKFFSEEEPFLRADQCEFDAESLTHRIMKR
nr:EOG090X0HUX [Triops cancriformis]